MNKDFKKLRKHASGRAKSRFDFGSYSFNRHIYQDAVNCIRYQRTSGVCELVRHIETQTNKRTMWPIKINGNNVLAIYDRKKKAIATFMPPEFKNVKVEEDLLK